MMRSSVDLPQPEGPTKTTNSWSRTSRSREGITVTVAEALDQPVHADRSHPVRLR